MRRLALIVFVGACTHHRSMADLTEVSGEVTVETTSGGEILATAKSTPNGVVLQDGFGVAVDPAAIAKVTDERSLRGAFEGLAIGGGIGIVAGAIIGYAGGDDPPCDECWFQMSAASKATVGAVVIGVIGGFVGLATGAVRGSQFVYEGAGPSPIIITPSGPPGSVLGVTVDF